MTYAPNDYALLIGINDYPQWNAGQKSLKGPIRDATEFRNWLIDPEGGGLLPGNVHLLTSQAQPLGPLQIDIDKAFWQIRQNSEGKERRRFYFYFSGHGHSPAGSWRQQCLRRDDRCSPEHERAAGRSGVGIRCFGPAPRSMLAATCPLRSAAFNSRRPSCF